jgi:hypothetical protein
VTAEEHFPVPLELRALSAWELKSMGSDRQLYQLSRAFIYVDRDGMRIDVPAGFKTDFASIPRWVWSYISPEDPVILFASVIHDFLYTRKGDLGPESRVAFNRQQADEVLRQAMLVCGARATQAWVVYNAVRLGGGSHWK